MSRRILVIGSGGAGKSTLTRRLGERLGLPVIHLDAHYWRPGWQPTPPDEWRERVRELVAGDAWVMDGNYGGTMELRLAASDLVLFLDLPPHVCVARVVRRWWRHRGRTRPELGAGNPEQLTWEFLWWIWTYRARRRGQVLQQLARVTSSTRVVVLRSDEEVERFVASLPVAPSG